MKKTTELHPVIYDSVKKQHYVVAGSLWDNKAQRSMLVCFPSNKNEYVLIRGAFDKHNGKVYSSHRFIIQTNKALELSSSQREVLESHITSNIVHEKCLITLCLHSVINNNSQLKMFNDE